MIQRGKNAMKKFLLLLCTIACTQTDQILASQGKNKPSICLSILSNIAYFVSSFVGRNDYLYLAHKNQSWYLKNKIGFSKDNDFDSYYPRYRVWINGRALTPHYTPLHEAICRGNLDSVRELLAAGADKSKKVDLEPSSQAIAKESKNLQIFQERVNLAQENFIPKLRVIITRLNIGLNATELAQKMRETKQDEDPDKKDERVLIHALLNDEIPDYFKQLINRTC